MIRPKSERPCVVLDHEVAEADQVSREYDGRSASHAHSPLDRTLTTPHNQRHVFEDSSNVAYWLLLAVGAKAVAGLLEVQFRTLGPERTALHPIPEV